MRRFPAPWTVEALDGRGFKIVDWNGQSLAYVYGHADPRVGQDGRKAFSSGEAWMIFRAVLGKAGRGHRHDR